MDLASVTKPHSLNHKVYELIRFQPDALRVYWRCIN